MNLIKMKLTCFLLAFSLGFAPLLSSAAPNSRPLNVLFIATDDWRVELGCYGTKGMVTPNVDKFSAGAVRFDRAYCQFPLCNPSRTSLLTGRYPTVSGVMDNTTAFRDAHPDWVTLPQHFKNNGYAVARTGKIFHGTIDDPKSWGEVAAGPVPGATGGSKQGNKPNAAPGQPKKQQGQYPQMSDRIVVLSDPDGRDHVDYHTADRGIELMKKYKDGGKPFFIAVGFIKPHSPPSAPKRFFDLYDASKIELPPDFQPRPTLPAGFPAASLPMRNGDLFINRDASEQEAREVIRAYHASASWTDWNVGRVLNALDELGLAGNTIVFFMGDHGYHLGEKGKWSKHGSLFEVGVRVPFIMRVPGAAGNGKASSGTVQFLDLYPTLIELCGLPQAQGIQGVSFAPLLDNPDHPWNHPAFSVSKTKAGVGKTVRTDRWRYTWWEDGVNGHVLFDEQADPHELKNLADDPAHAETVAKMKGLLSGDWTKARAP
jgi:iduronate 2-sulfatase